MAATGIMSTAGPELPYSCISRPSLGSSLLGFESNMTVVVACITCWFNILGVRLDVICKLETLSFVIRVKVAYISNTNTLGG